MEMSVEKVMKIQKITQDPASYTLLREQLEEVMKTLTPREAKN